MVSKPSQLSVQSTYTVEISPNQWFGTRFPQEAKLYGNAFLQSFTEHQGFRIINLPSINLHFHAAILNARKDLGHHLVYMADKHTFYFKDHDGLFKATTEQKLQTLTACRLMKCAEDMPLNVERQKLIVEYRSAETLRTITQLARSMFLVEPEFFESGNHRRKEGRESMIAVTRHFVTSAMQPSDEAIVSIDDVYNAYLLFCEEKGFKGATRNAFKQLIGESVRDEHGIGIRNDLRDASGCWRRGWKGITLKGRRIQKFTVK